MDCIFDLSFNGSLAEGGQLQFYDLAHALWGFERTISITTHLLLTGSVITQSPSGKGFYITVFPPEVGSWKIKVALGLGGISSAFGLAPPDTLFGWLAKSSVEYVIQEALGFTPDFEKTLGSQIRDYRKKDGGLVLPSDLSQGRFDAVLEKCEAGLRDMHRPIVFSRTASIAQINYTVGPRSGAMDAHFDEETYRYIARTITTVEPERYCGVISSYNVNSFSGRIYLPDFNRTVPFELQDIVRYPKAINTITLSLRRNATRRAENLQGVDPDICLEAVRNESISGRLRKIYVVGVEPPLSILD